MWEILQTGTDSFEVRCGDVIVDTTDTWDAAVVSLAAHAQAALAVLADAGVSPAGDGLLPETWTSTAGIAFSENTGDGRDFTQCAWTSRDPAQSLLPLMLQTVTEVGHFGAVWCGFLDTIVAGKTSTATGRFYDNAEGIRARDMMLGGRIAGVSVDPGAVDVQFTCTEEDEFGFCINGIMEFLAYEIIGLTITPFPAFARAAITLSSDAVAAAVSAPPLGVPEDPLLVRAEWPNLVASVPEVPEVIPAEWFRMAEPTIGDPLLVRQPPEFDGDDVEHWAVPLTVTDDGRVFGHAARGGSCHVGIRGECVPAPMSATNYAFFHLGVTRTDEGDLATGVLIAGCDHYPTEGRRSGAAGNYYDHSGLQWADVRASNGVHGVWVCGALREVTPAQLRVIRSCGLSGDWEDRGGNLELIAAQCVNVPGFPVLREYLAASGLNIPTLAGPSYRRSNGRVVALSAAGVVRRPCPDCEAQRAARTALRFDSVDPRQYMASLGVRLEAIERILARLDQRTAPLRRSAAQELAERISGQANVQVASNGH